MPADFRPLFETLSPPKRSASTSAPFSPMPAPKPAAAEKPDHNCGEPKVELKRDGDRITHIRVQCRCGDVIELACEY